MKYLWVRWNDQGPRAKRFQLFTLARNRKKKSQLANGPGYSVVLGLRHMRTVDLHAQESADLEEAAKAFVEAEGGKFCEYWTEEAENE